AGTYPYVKGFLGNVAGVEVVNPSTVQIRLKAPLTPFLQYLAHHSLYVYSPEALKKWGKDMVKHPVGTGPFKLETWEPGVKVVLVRNDDYWAGAPKIRQAIYVPIIEAQARLSAIKTGEIDLTMDVPPDSLDDLRKDPNIVVAGVVRRAEYAASDPEGQARAPGDELCGEQGSDHPRHLEGHGRRRREPAVARVWSVCRARRPALSLRSREGEGAPQGSRTSE